MKSGLSKHARPNLITALKMALNTSVIGAPFATLIDDIFNQETNKVIEETLDRLKDRMDELEGRIDPSAARGDEVSELVKRYLLSINLLHRREKLDAANEIFVNALLKPGDPKKLDHSELEVFMQCVERLPVGVYRVLAVIVSITRRQLGDLRALNFGAICSQMPDDDPDVVMAMIRQLDSCGLAMVHAPSVRAPKMANYPVELTKIGERFANHIACSPREDSPVV